MNKSLESEERQINVIQIIYKLKNWNFDKGLLAKNALESQRNLKELMEFNHIDPEYSKDLENPMHVNEYIENLFSRSEHPFYINYLKGLENIYQQYATKISIFVSKFSGNNSKLYNNKNKLNILKSILYAHLGAPKIHS